MMMMMKSRCRITPTENHEYRNEYEQRQRQQWDDDDRHQESCYYGKLNQDETSDNHHCDNGCAGIMIDHPTKNLQQRRRRRRRRQRRIRNVVEYEEGGENEETKGQIDYNNNNENIDMIFHAPDMIMLRQKRQSICTSTTTTTSSIRRMVNSTTLVIVLFVMITSMMMMATTATTMVDGFVSPNKVVGPPSGITMIQRRISYSSYSFRNSRCTYNHYLKNRQKGTTYHRSNSASSSFLWMGSSSSSNNNADADGDRNVTKSKSTTRVPTPYVPSSTSTAAADTAPLLPVFLATTTTTPTDSDPTKTKTENDEPTTPTSTFNMSPAPVVVSSSDTAAAASYSEEERAYLFVEDEVALEDVYEVAVRNTLGWVALASAFGFALSQIVSVKTAEEFFAGYIVEQSLSVDNLFVFLLLFDYFKVPTAYQNRVLSWGIIGAIVMRGTMIGLGAAALKQFHAILLVFASFLVYSGVTTLKEFIFSSDEEDDDDEADVSDDIVVKFSKQLFDSVDYFDGDRFFTTIEGVKKATPLLLCMVAVEISDVVFAVDSIPAVFGVTENPLVVFSSNLFAIMGLRSLYTVLSKAASDLEYLEPAVALVLGFIGSKMIAEYFGWIIPVNASLLVVSTILASGVLLSLSSKNQKALLEQQQSQQSNTGSSAEEGG